MVSEKHKNISKADFSSKRSWRKKGQLSIFFALSMVIFASVLAFIVNLGLFVKARINLQNAVDSAAFAGAAVQARQLTSIGYLNWEMRNTYKEWMFKYYVLGHISHPKIYPTHGSDNLMFQLDRFDPNDPPSDLFNIPSICISFAGAYNICSRYEVPGLPRHNTQGAPGVDETYNAAYNQIAKAKSEDCSKRSDFNFMTAMMWAYGTGSANPNDDLFTTAPQIAAQRPGAWPEAIEYAVRVRNLEFIVNQPPKENLCLTGNGCNNIDDLNTTGSPLNERTIAAFWSAARNIGNDDPRGPGLMKSTFKMSELAPTPLPQRPQSLSYLFIPNAYDKYYLDLQAYVLNLTTFFTSFVTTTKKGSVPKHAACDVSKTGLPIPGYPFGFVKNPNFLTYYAVKAESGFVGMLNPFASSTTNPIKLHAYAAAKPFGGRIGPRLFAIDPGNNQTVSPRSDRSWSYIMGLRPPAGQFTVGFPVPADAGYWISNGGTNEILGGFPTSNNVVKFGIPNLIYDLPINESKQTGNSPIDIIAPVAPAQHGMLDGPNSAGLYDAYQFSRFIRNLDLAQNTNANQITKEETDQAIINVRKPTLYDALNYMIPTFSREPQTVSGNDPESYDPVVKSNTNGRDTYELYAPLFANDLLYQEAADIEKGIKDHITSNTKAIETFTKGLETVANFIRAEDQNTAQQLYLAGADKLHDGKNGQLSCNSLAGKFAFFFLGTSSGVKQTSQCDKTLEFIIQKAWGRKASEFPGFQQSIKPTYFVDSDIANSQLKSGFAPGPESGATDDAQINHPFLNNAPLDGHRNFYSTKLISLSSLFSGGGRYASSYIGPSSFTSYSEGNEKSPQAVTNEVGQFENPLKEQDITSDGWKLSDIFF